MKKQVILLSGLIFLLMLISSPLFSQVGINTDGSQPDPSAMLDVKSQVKGFLPPRIALTSLDVHTPVATPVAVGLLVFNTVNAGIPPNNVVPGYYYWNGGRWVSVATPSGVNPGEMLYWNGNAWVTIPAGSHGQQLYFCNGLPTWGGCYPQVITTALTNINQSSVVTGGDVISDGGSTVVARGVCWSTNENPTVSDDKTIDGSGTGAYNSYVSGLAANTQYYLRAYATNGVGTVYGNEEPFMTTVYPGAPVTALPFHSACPGSPVDVPVTVSGFENIGNITLTLHYNSTMLTYSGTTNTSGYPGLVFGGSTPGIVTITGAASPGITYPDNTVLFTLHFNFTSGPANLTWYDNGPSCQYFDGNLNILNDDPSSVYYLGGTVNPLGEVGSPVFEEGPVSARCQGAELVEYKATAANSTGITYTLDALSIAAGNSINPTSGIVSYTAAWTGTSVITAHAEGCNGPKLSEHTVTINQVLPVSLTIAASSNTVCAGTSVMFTASPVNGGISPAYQWIVNGNNAGNNNETFTYTPVSGDQVSCVLTSNATCPQGNPATSNTVTMTVDPSVPAGVSIAASSNPVCEGTSVTFTATPSNGGESPVYQWKVNGTEAGSGSTYAYNPQNGDAVTCVMTSVMSCATGNPALSNEIIMSVIAVPEQPAGVTIEADPAGPITGGTEVTFTATPVNGGASPAYQWKVNNINSGTNNSTFSYVPINGDEIICILTSNAPCVNGNPATSNSIVMEVNQAMPVSVSIEASANPSCAGTLVTFTATPVNGGASPAYEWRVNGVNAGTNSPVFDFAPNHNDIITCVLTSSEPFATGNPATSNAVTMEVTATAEAGVSIVASGNPFCTGAQVTFTADPAGAGTTPVYQWKVNGADVGSNATTFSYNPADGDVVTCVMTSSLTCVTGNPATSNPITMTANPVLPVSISIVESANQICSGTSVDFTATPGNGGTNPSYQWKVNGINAGTNSAAYTYVPGNNDAVTCVLTSSHACTTGNPAESNTIMMIVNPNNPVSASIVADPAGAVCQGAQVTYTATVINGGSAPVYSWKVNGNSVGTNNAVYTYIPVSGDQVSCVLTSNAICATGSPAASNTITMTVNPPLAVSVSIAPSVNPVCAGTSVTFTATPVNGGSAPVYQWKVNGTVASGATNATYSYIPVNNDAVSCTLTSNAPCATGNPAASNQVTMIVNQSTTVKVSIASSLYAVMPGTQVTLTATPENGGTEPTYQWRLNGTNITGANSASYTYTPSNLDRLSCIVTSSSTESCLMNNPATSNTAAMVVYVAGTPCTDVPTVSYGGYTYNTVQIGTQCWFRENLKIGNKISYTVAQTNNSIIEKYCYNDSLINCDIYGGLYQWNELMQYVTTAGAQGICPTGWHVPTDAEFSTLATFLGGSTVSGGKLKEIGTNHWKTPNTSAANTYGFTALPGGYSSVSPYTFGSINRYGYFYTSTTVSSYVYYWTVGYSSGNQDHLQNYKTTGNGVRCLKN